MRIGSAPLTLAGSDLKKVLINAVIVAVSAVISYALTIIPQIELQNSTAMLLVPLVSAVLVTIQKYLTDTRVDVPAPPVEDDTRPRM